MEQLTEHPIETVISDDGEIFCRACAVCGRMACRLYFVAMEPVVHKCRRDEVDVLVYWPGWSG